MQGTDHLAYTAGAPVCFLVSCHAGPTSCERDLSAPVVVMGEWDEKVNQPLASLVPLVLAGFARSRQALSLLHGETTVFAQDPRREKSQESACYTGYRLRIAH